MHPLTVVFRPPLVTQGSALIRIRRDVLYEDSAMELTKLGELVDARRERCLLLVYCRGFASVPPSLPPSLPPAHRRGAA